ncbi:unnamed protein product [Phyllotreta striolata]|uniref:CCHC-type domain-containing protein n=1 Tax=Phyllotreta striolata TaxID=444603 RepID=A0A9N9XJS1_PHYSR|nr:unnamed protein product [Phyllotreta striolata]
MVCKEDVLLWFKDLDSHDRIDLMYELLNMCLPFELRFFGSCIEELGKHTYQELRGPTLMANDLEKLSKDASFSQGVVDESVRHRLIIYLSVLSSRNYNVANWVFNNALRTDSIEEYLKDNGKEEMLISEFLLLYTMALHHPAFTFEQKQFFSRVLVNIIGIRENRVSARHSALGYPPGFGYPTQKQMEVPVVPVKTAPTTCGDSPAIFHQPPGLGHMPPVPHVDFTITPISWNRGFPYGAPEVPSFPPPQISPLVSQAASPSQSRSTSPLRTPIVRPPPPPPPGAMQPPPLQLSNVPPPLTLPPPTNIEIVTGPIVPTQLPVEPPQSAIPVFNPPPDIKTIEDDPVKIEEKRDILWPQQCLINPDAKPNGVRFPLIGNVGKIRPYLVEQIQAMNLEGENSLHRSNSSSNSSLNETPPGTPSLMASTTTPAPPPHGPGRGGGAADMKGARSNGMPFGGPSPMPDTQSPPPNFSNNSVPYSFPQPFATLPPNRSMFHYNQAYRPNFTAHFPNFPPTDNFPTYTFPYYPIMYSSSQYQPRTPPGCYNCGAPGHLGSECTSQNIEEITQKKTYVLDYTSSLHDSEK